MPLRGGYFDYESLISSYFDLCGSTHEIHGPKIIR